jgi:hypothetical protein
MSSHSGPNPAAGLSMQPLEDDPEEEPEDISTR